MDSPPLSPTQQYRQTLLNMEEFEDLGESQKVSKCLKYAPWIQGLSSACLLAGSIATRVLIHYVAAQASASCVIGLSTVALATAAIPTEKMARVRQVLFPIIGQTALYGFTQGYYNDSNREHQIGLINAISGLFGGNFQLSLSMLWEKGVIRSESLPQQLDASHALKGVAAVGLGLISYWISVDKIVQPVSGYFCSFLAAQVLGEHAIDRIDKKISEADQKNVGTRWRTAKSAVLTLSYLGQILTFCLLPWKKSAGAERLLHLRISGGLLGLFDGLLVRSQGQRIQQYDIGELEELAKLPDPEKSWQKKLLLIWKIAIPFITIGGLLGFSIQQMYKLPNLEQKLGLWLTFIGLVAGTGVCHLSEKLWNPQKRHFIKDQLMSSIWYSHRFFGIDPIYFYFALINSVQIDSTAIADQKSHYHTAAILTAWFFYGFRWGHEQFIGLSDRKGNAPIKYPKFVMFNAAMNTAYEIIGAN